MKSLTFLQQDSSLICLLACFEHLLCAGHRAACSTCITSLCPISRLRQREKKKPALRQTLVAGGPRGPAGRPTTLRHLRVQWGVRGNGQDELLQRSCAKAITDSQSWYSINNRKWWPINCRCLNTVSHIGNLCPYFSYPQTSLKALKIEILKIFD